VGEVADAFHHSVELPHRKEFLGMAMEMSPFTLNWQERRTLSLRSSTEIQGISVGR
jgi:hypothetical protein